MKPFQVAAAAACVATLLIAGAPARATPPTGVTATLTYDETVGGTRVAVRRITIAPGGDTGYHYHDGPLHAVVTAGTLTHYGADCQVDHVYQAGDLVHEPAGPHNVHIGRNEGRTPLVLEVTYLLPAGAPFAQDAPPPPCA
ncbi:cupin domain-containing protein [Phytohabitans houttuyneae]|uniref:Cupin n=1 Tax=Phytohabitans houttuyneae TaxID=1076126 RepID=A0A6V8JUB5_9ACTN|nr:cupin domain-containing protein [Phytohabitans houttuyneae]GFJ76172.1 cupin [Phytohabitans houttuyneae]